VPCDPLGPNSLLAMARTEQGTIRSFYIHLDKNLFHCLKCDQKGDAIDLRVRAPSQLPYDAAVDLGAKLGINVLWLHPAHRPGNR